MYILRFLASTYAADVIVIEVDAAEFVAFVIEVVVDWDVLVVFVVVVVEIVVVVVKQILDEFFTENVTQY